MGGERGKGEGVKQALRERRGRGQDFSGRGLGQRGGPWAATVGGALCGRKAIGYHETEGPINVGGGSFDSLRSRGRGLK